ncbi:MULTISPECIES: sensor histidine kinase [Streptosporangium]|uniref:histidine kinase n=1 Tax=Streptosporangium brasiliense TaxID=47480 RepID=A0ABT9RFZ2_9ACTN|nr:sensor histidine kinase [Streptosporangium brasiliense]MDP9868043.1 signal transduction histidine kinase [Streptosporangium brasiliense]
MRTLLTWCGLAALVPLLYAMTLIDGESLLPVGTVHAACAVAMAVPLAWARRWPGVVLAVSLTEIVVAAALGQPAQRIWPLFLAADVLVGLLTALRPRRAGLAAAAVTLVVQETIWQVDLLRHGLRGWASGFLALSVLLGLGVLVACMAGLVVRQRRAYDRALRAHAEARVITDERLRIARELHDTVAHSIGIIAIQAGAGARVIDHRPEQARQALDAIEATSRQTLRGLRHMLGVLRETGDERLGAPPEPAPAAGLADVDRLAETTTAAGVRVDVRRHGRPRPLPAAVDRSAFRIVQESVTNVLRHAGTGRCQVVIGYGDEDLRIEVVDDGRGAVTPASALEGSGHGIAGMRERVALLGGDFGAGPRPEGGFRVTARLPLATSTGHATARVRAEADRVRTR